MGDGPGPAPGIEGASVLDCTASNEIPPSRFLIDFDLEPLIFTTDVDLGASGRLTASFEVAGGNASQQSGDPCGQSPSYEAPPCARAEETTTITTAAPQFGIDVFDSQLSADPAGAPFTQAGSDPYQLSVQLDMNTASDPLFGLLYPVEPAKDIVVDLPPGFVGNPTGIGQCTSAQLAPTPLPPARPTARLAWA